MLSNLKSGKIKVASIVLLSSAALISLLVLSAYLLRAPITQWVLADFLPSDTQITCSHFDIGVSPLLTIQKLCIDSESLKIEMHEARWFLDNWQRKESRLSIAKLTIHHRDTGVKVNQNAPPFSQAIALPSNMPRITIDALSLTSYLLHQPLNVTLTQRSLSAFSLSGDINAGLDYLDGRLQGTITWSPSQLLAQSPLLQEKTDFLHQQLNWQTLMNTKINSQFIFAGDRIETRHTLAVHPQITIDNCPINAEAKGTIGINLTLSNLEAIIDARDFPISAIMQECQLIPAQFQHLQIREAHLTASNPLLFKENVFTTSGIMLSLPRLQTDPVVTLTDIEIGLDRHLSFMYRIKLISEMANVNIVDTNFKGAVTLASVGKAVKNNNDWTIFSESATIDFATPNSKWASADRLLNNFNYRISLSEPEQVDISFAGLQRIVGLKSKSRDNSVFQAKQIETDWEVTHSGGKVWEIKLKNNIPELNTAQIKVSKLSNISNITITPDRGLKLSAQSAIQSVTYSDKKLTKLTFEHELLTQPERTKKPTTLKVSGSHQIQLGSGLKMQIDHTQEDFKIAITDQALTTLQKLLSQFNSKIRLSAGTFNAELKGSLSSVNYSGILEVASASLQYDDFQLIALQLNEPFELNSAGIQLKNGTVQIDELDVGIPIRKIELAVDVIDNVAKLQLAQGEMMGGTFKFTNLWLDDRKQQTSISVSGLDLADFVALQKQQGIQVTGKMSGVLPFQLGANDTIIEHGLLVNDGPGKFKIENNPAFDAIKGQQKKLSFLQNVEYRTLSSKVELASDGWLDLQLSIAGRNPDQKQEVIFNYGHNENMFTLLKSLRLTRSMQDSIEKRIEQRYLEKGK